MTAAGLGFLLILIASFVSTIAIMEAICLIVMVVRIMTAPQDCKYLRCHTVLGTWIWSVNED